MANAEHVRILKQGVEVWNRWRGANPYTLPDFTQANLIDTNLVNANLSFAHLSFAYLINADLSGADLGNACPVSAYFINVNLSGADLSNVNLIGTNLSNANLSNTNLFGTNLSGTDLSNANLSDAVLAETVLANIDLSHTQGLETCEHRGPSTIDHRTLARSGQLPLSFLRGIGLPDTFIDYVPSLFNQPLQFYSCFISYSSKDEEFAQRLHADLQDKGVRCWYAPEDLPIGAKIRVGIDQAIRKHDKLLLVLSEHSVTSQWVEQEVETALEKERQRDQLVLFPVRLDNAVMDSGDGWTRLIKNTRNIGDFTRWKDYDAYQQGLNRLVRDLKASLESKDNEG